ncbi:MAG: 2Fe-2S ferredoxin [Chitinophagia bacterium]|nr:2Fe-2S ferredoxin [Chitinophagia bacterium]
MITVYFVRNGMKIRVDVPIGMTLMEAAKKYSVIDIREITADCGGACACGTCHVIIDERCIDKIAPMNENYAELDLLEFDKQYKKGLSRLACQIYLTKEHDGLIAHLLDEDIR